MSRTRWFCLIVLLFAAALRAQGNNLSSRRAWLSDNFSTPEINAQNWVFGNHPNNYSRVQSGALLLRSEGKTSGWIHTRERFTLRDKIIQLKMLQPNGDGALGLSPTVTSTSPIAFSAEQNFYRFYTSRDETTGPCRLYVQWSKAGVVDGLEVAPEIEIKPNSYLRLMTRGEVLYFQYSLDGNEWQTVYAEFFALPGYTLDDRFYIEIAAGYTARNGDWLVDDFLLQSNDASASSHAEKIVLHDPLREHTLGAQTGGRFVPGGGWQTIGKEDMLVYDLGEYLENGMLEIEVRNFKPNEQNTHERHHFLAMFRFPWGNHHAVETQSMFWDLHTGTMYAPGVKLQSSSNFVDEKASIIKTNWKREETYRLRVVWNGRELQYFRNGALQALHTHDEPLQLRYLFIGRDYTVSGDLMTNFNGNQYPAFVGPIYSNLIVKKSVASHDKTPPLVNHAELTSLYANAARLRWTTNELASCIVEYGTSINYGRQTPVLGPPEQEFSTTLANLAANQIYHYRIVARDAAGNRATTTDATFTTMKSGLYLFPPSADTFVEKNNIYGETRSHANFGWMNLLASDGRECYLRFKVAGLEGSVARAALRLHGRQSGKGGGILRALTSAWEESSVTWLTKPDVEETDLGYIDEVIAGEWQGIALRDVVNGNGEYGFALIGRGETVSFDSRESTNHQPELLVALRAQETSAPNLTALEVERVTSASAIITWKTNEPATALVRYGIDASYDRVVADTTDFALQHRLALRNLQPYKKYFCRVQSADLAGNVSTSAELEFETPPARLEQVALHEVFEAHFKAANAGESPYLNGPELTVTFSGTDGAAQGKVVKVSGFWDGKNIYLARFAPHATGTWSWHSESSDAGMHGQSGTLTCIGRLPAAHVSARGHVQAAKLFAGTLAHADSTPFFLAGAQLESWFDYSSQHFQKYVVARAAQGFNYVQALAFALTGLNEKGDGSSAAFIANDMDRLNPDYWRGLDERVALANRSGMLAGLCLLPAKAAAHFLNEPQVQRFIKYIVRRYSAYNIVWVLDETENFTPETLATLIRSSDPDQRLVVLPAGAASRREDVAYAHMFASEDHQSANRERRIVLQPLSLAQKKNAAEQVREQTWPVVMQGRFFLLLENTRANFAEESLYDEGTNMIKVLRDFWSSDLHHAVPWWKFTRFEMLDKARWFAGKPGEAYVVYSESNKEFKIDLSEVQGEVRGEWFNTRTGLWSTAFSGAASRSFALKPPGEGYAAFLWVYRD